MHYSRDVGQWLVMQGLGVSGYESEEVGVKSEEISQTLHRLHLCN